MEDTNWEDEPLYSDLGDEPIVEVNETLENRLNIDEDPNLPESGQIKKNLLENKKNFVFGFEETLVNFRKTMEIMNKQAEVMTRFADEFNSGDKKQKNKKEDENPVSVVENPKG